MISGTKVKLGKDGGTMEFIQQFVNHWNGELIRDYDLIEDVVVNTETPTTIFFSN